MNVVNTNYNAYGKSIYEEIRNRREEIEMRKQEQRILERERLQMTCKCIVTNNERYIDRQNGRRKSGKMTIVV